MDSLKDIAGTLRAARAMLGLSQDEVAKQAKVSRQMLARIEAAGRGIGYDAVERVRETLERRGVDFFPSTSSHGPAVALRKDRADGPPALNQNVAST